MCLPINKKQKPQIATEPIVCFKCLTVDLLSPCFSQKYELGEMLTSEFSIETRNYCNTIEKGLHSYANESEAKYVAYNYTWFNQISGYNQKAPVVVKCIIPKDATYYKAESMTSCVSYEYASNQLIPVEIVEICQ